MSKDILNPKNLSREQLAVLRVKCDNDLLYFTRLFFKVLRGSKFIMSDHHKELANHFDDVANYKVKLLNINIPPRHSKTELAINFIARGIGINPSSNWLYISAADELRSEASVRIRDIISCPLFIALYGIKLKRDQNSKNIWKTTEGGGLKTATIFGQVTGFGAGQMTEAGFNDGTIDLIRNFEGCQVWDDLNKTEDSESENANNDKVSRVVFNTLLSRENSHDTPIIHIQQRTGMSDATASLMEHYGTDKDSHRFVVMPIIKSDGTPLWATKFPMSKIIELKTSHRTKHMFDTQYMQNPLPREGVMFLRKDMNFFNSSELNMERIDSRIGNIDVADLGRDSFSFPSGILIGSKFYVTEWIHTQQGTEFTRPKAASIVNHNKIEHLGIEANSVGLEFGRRLKTEIHKRATIYPKYNTKKKETRILQGAEFIRSVFVFRSDLTEGSDYQKALEQLFRYMKNGSYKKDDAPDSLAGLSQLIQELDFPQFRNI